MIKKKKSVEGDRMNVKSSNNNYRNIIILLLLLSLGTVPVFGQKMALKTNALGWVTATPNMEAEFVLNRHISLCMGIAANPISTDKIKTRFTHFQPEVRYWINRPMVSHFVGITAFTNSFDIMLDDKYHKGDAVAAGLTYGYAWILGNHWNMELTAGIGMLKYRQFEYEKGTARPAYHNGIKTIIAPIKLGVSFVYVIR